MRAAPVRAARPRPEKRMGFRAVGGTEPVNPQRYYSGTSGAVGSMEHGTHATLGVARCGGSAGCMLGVLWAVPAAVLEEGGGTLWG